MWFVVNVQVEEDEMGRTCCLCGGERDYWENIAIGGRIILKWILGK
jgi:hypothetical protein